MQEKHKGKADKVLAALCSNQRDPHHRCPACAEHNTDELLHYFTACPFFLPIFEAHLRTTLEYLKVTVNWAHEGFDYDIIKRYPSDRERMLIFKDFPPEIRTNDKETKSQLITALMIMQQTVQTFIKEKIYQPDIFAIYEKFRTNINLIERVYPGTIAKHYMKRLKRQLKETERPEMDATNHPILVPLEHKIIRVRVHQMVSTIKLYALTAYDKYRKDNTLRLNAMLKNDHDRRQNKLGLSCAKLSSSFAS